MICPYHKWTYELDGRLVGAARMPADFKIGDHGLLPVQVELAAGCIYVALTSGAPDFTPFRTALESRLGVYRLADAKVAFQSTLIEKANWKLVMENARECYHCAASHPELKLAYPVSYGAAVGKDRLDIQPASGAREWSGWVCRPRRLSGAGGTSNAIPSIREWRASRWTVSRS